jgi:hypothetical protein
MGQDLDAAPVHEILVSREGAGQDRHIAHSADDLVSESLDQAVHNVRKAAIDQGSAAPELRHGNRHTGAEKRLEDCGRAQSALGDEPAPGIPRPGDDRRCLHGRRLHDHVRSGLLDHCDCRAVGEEIGLPRDDSDGGVEDRRAGSGRDLEPLQALPVAPCEDYSSGSRRGGGDVEQDASREGACSGQKNGCFTRHVTIPGRACPSSRRDAWTACAS